MKKILVSGASGIVGYGILRSLINTSQNIQLIASSIYTDSVAQGFCNVFEQAPHTNNSCYIDWLLNIIKKHDIDLIIPGIEIDMYKWVECRDDIDKTGVKALLNDDVLINQCKDKFVFYKSLKEANISCVIESSLCDNFEKLVSLFGLPFLLKPRHGFGSKGIVKVDNENTFNKHKNSIGKLLMVQPIVGNDNEEFTTSAFCDGKGGFYACMTLRRKLSKDGFTDRAEVVSSDEFLSTISKLCKKFNPIGPTNFQFRKSKSGIKLLEINPRISSSTSIRTAFGYNESIMSVNYFLKKRTISQPEIRRGKAVRYTEEYVFYDEGIHL